MGFNLASIIGDNVGDFVSKVAGIFKVPPEQVLASQTEITKLQLDLQGKLIDQVGQQLDVNKVEAASSSTFVAGWRPAIGWVCGLGLFVQFIVNPIATWFAALAKHPIVFPSLDLGTLMTLLLGMLGLGTMRTFEKIQGAPGSDKVH